MHTYRHDRRSSIAASMILAAVAAVASAQPALAHDDDSTPPLAPLGQIITHQLDSGLRSNADRMTQTVYADVITTPNALWTRLYFSNITLEGASRIRFTSLLDGHVQELDAAGAAMWGNASAYFNGPAVMIELIAAPGTTGNRFVLEQLGVDLGAQPIGNHCASPLVCGLCDGDTRVPSNEQWACRLVSASGGCSAAIYNESSMVVSAGHCMGASMVIQFNVPLSNPNCTINHPPVADQFPITSQLSQNAGVGADWAVLTSGTNSLDQTAFERFGEYRPIAVAVPNSGPADGWGYGVSDDCVLRQTQQHSSGQILNLTGSTVLHSADTTCGNSGGSILSGGAIIGIATHCSSTCPMSGNTATRIDLPAFADARQLLEAKPESVLVPDDYATIQAAIDAVAPGSTITVAAGTYNEAINFIGKNLTVISADGPDVTIINAAGTDASVVRFASNESADALLQGFTLTGGTGSATNLGGTVYIFGGGIYASGSSPTIDNCIIIDNTAQFGGGVFALNASPTFTDCVIQSNESTSAGGGAFSFSGAQMQFFNTQFVSNIAQGGGGAISSQSAGPMIITNCQFIENHAGTVGGAVRMIQSSYAEITNCSFQSNVAGDTGGALSTDASPSVSVADSEFCANAPNHIAGAHIDEGGNTFEAKCTSPCAGPADLNCDGVISVGDLLMLLAAWGPCADPGNCPQDLDGNGIVNVGDLLMLLGSWG